MKNNVGIFLGNFEIKLLDFERNKNIELETTIRTIIDFLFIYAHSILPYCIIIRFPSRINAV